MLYVVAAIYAENNLTSLRLLDTDIYECREESINTLEKGIDTDQPIHNASLLNHYIQGDKNYLDRLTKYDQNGNKLNTESVTIINSNQNHKIVSTSIGEIKTYTTKRLIDKLISGEIRLTNGILVDNSIIPLDDDFNLMTTSVQDAEATRKRFYDKRNNILNQFKCRLVLIGCSLDIEIVRCTNVAGYNFFVPLIKQSTFRIQNDDRNKVSTIYIEKIVEYARISRINIPLYKKVIIKALGDKLQILEISINQLLDTLIVDVPKNLIRVTKGMFSNVSAKCIDISRLNTNNMLDMSSMFSGNNIVKRINFSNIDVSNVINMIEIFSGCRELEELDLSTLRTDSLENMGTMFNGCHKLKELNLNYFDTSHVISMHRLFAFCNSLETLHIENLDTSNVCNMYKMFENCKALKILNLSSFKTAKVSDMMRMFHKCESLEYVDISHFDVSKVENVTEMFSKCTSLKQLNLGKFNIPEDTRIWTMFIGVNKEVEIQTENKNINKRYNELKDYY